MTSSPLTDPRDLALAEIRARCLAVPALAPCRPLAEGIFKMADDALNAPEPLAALGLQIGHYVSLETLHAALALLARVPK